MYICKFIGGDNDALFNYKPHDIEIQLLKKIFNNRLLILKENINNCINSKKLTNNFEEIKLFYDEI